MFPHKISPMLLRGNFVSPHKISPILHRGILCPHTKFLLRGILCPHTKFPLCYLGGILCPHTKFPLSDIGEILCPNFPYVTYGGFCVPTQNFHCIKDYLLTVPTDCVMMQTLLRSSAVH